MRPEKKFLIQSCGQIQSCGKIRHVLKNVTAKHHELTFESRF